MNVKLCKSVRENTGLWWCHPAHFEKLDCSVQRFRWVGGMGRKSAVKSMYHNQAFTLLSCSQFSQHNCLCMDFGERTELEFQL